MTSQLLWMTTGGLMTEEELVKLKLELARAWIQNGQEDLAKDLVRSIIERDIDDKNV